MTSGSGARRAILGDEEEIIRLREQMAWAVWRVPAPAADDPMHVASVEKVRGWLKEGEGASTAVFVVDAPDGDGLAASVIGAVDERLPSMRNPAGRAGYVYGVCTDERYRRRGYSRMAMQALLDWYEGIGVRNVQLHASEYGEALYRELGFQPPDGLALTRIAPQRSS